MYFPVNVGAYPCGRPNWYVVAPIKQKIKFKRFVKKQKYKTFKYQSIKIWNPPVQDIIQISIIADRYG